MAPETHRIGEGVAIVGMAVRVPGARDVDQYWANLRAGRESISFFTVEELIALGKPRAVVTGPDYVPARGILDEAEMFDADFFAMSPREVEIVDPQQRLFLECAWQALERAGYDPDRAGVVGVFAGESMSEHFHYLITHRELLRFTGVLQASFGNERDYLATRTSYKLNLRGPSINVTNSCSTSLVAVHLACRSLLNIECDMALAGGVAINFPQKCGYTYEDGGILSPDGRCRPFDAQAQGTVGGNGVGVVVLKRLSAALTDGDQILAIIRGSAINNDGAMKAGYTAPSVEGQAHVIAAALAAAGVPPEEISYVEAHGTGTSLGDPIEVAALTRAFGPTRTKQFCAIGSVKSNIGHLDAAAGIAGLIKTVLALQHRMIPPSLHYEQANPQIDFANSPFYVNRTLCAWPDGNGPRRAGVSSFGIGGTNVHVVLEEAPAIAAEAVSHGDEILLVSARTERALEQTESQLTAHLAAHPDVSLRDAAYTLAVGRKHHRHRAALAAPALPGTASRPWRRQGEWGVGGRPVMLLLSGQGSQYVGMGSELYRTQPVFRDVVDRACGLLRGHVAVDPREILFAANGGPDAAAMLRQTWLTQPALFVVELAMARLWEHWGVQASALIGHSLGELVAATLAGVFSEEDGLRLAAARGRLMWGTEPGAMLVASLPPQDASTFVRERIALATVNDRRQVVFSGHPEAIAALSRELAGRDVPCRLLEVERAFHSPLMEPLRDDFLREAAAIPMRPPSRRFLSNVSGRWAGAEVADPEYWWRQLRGPVHFLQCVEQAAAEGEWLWIEVGPGDVLGTCVTRELAGSGTRPRVVSSLVAGHRESLQMAQAAAELWVHGVDIDWSRYYQGERRHRVALPTYPFERKHYMVPVPLPRLQAAPAPEADRSTQRDEVRTTVTTQAIPASALSARAEMLVNQLRGTWASVLGKDASALDPEATFAELGVDSLLLIQVSRMIREEYKIRIPFRQLLEEFNSIQALAAYLDATLPADQYQPTPAAPAAPAPAASMPVAPLPVAPAVMSGSDPAASLMDALIAQQTQVLLKQLDAVRALASPADHAGPAASPPVSAAVGVPEPSPWPSRPSSPPAAKKDKPEPFVPYQPIRPHAAAGLDDRQQRYLADFIERYNRRTARSKEHVARYRPVLSDNRAIQAFRLQWKELVYPIVGQRASGSRIWDLDGNEYVDMTMGFGVHLFGHAPPFVTDALRRQIDAGMGLGPQSPLAGEVAEGVSALTGMRRVAFCNSGTEAVMAALRLARLATGRNKVAMFAGSYHGTFDGNLARIERNASGRFETVPAGPGTPLSMVGDVEVFHYNEPESLDAIRARASEFAAVLVEPVQSRRPDVQPGEFLRELRRITEHSGTALIFDDIVTGFRIHPGGTQAWFGIRADLATYGKVLAGGMPVGVVCGRPEIMDGIDGGVWSFGDRSYPAADQMIFAGTFCKHPLSMAASHAVLAHLRASGPQLQEDLNRRAARCVESLNRICQEHGVPLQMVNCGSLLRPRILGNSSQMELFFYHLLHEGAFFWEGRTAFVSTSHTDEDLELVAGAFRRTIDVMRDAGFFAQSGTAAARTPAAAVRRVPATEAQKHLWAIAQLSRESSGAYNESFYVRTHHDIDPEALTRALQQVVDRHEALRTIFSADGQHQLILPSVTVPMPLLDLSGAEDQDARLATAMRAEARTHFDLSKGPLLRVLLVKLGGAAWQLSITAHHTVFDGWSGSVFLTDLDACYRAARSGAAVSLPEPMQFERYAAWQDTQTDLAPLDESRQYWMRRFQDAPPLLDLPLDQTRPSIYTHAGAEERFTIEGSLVGALRAFCGERQITLFTAMLAAYTAFLGRVTGRPELIVGIHSAGQTLVDGQELIGHCINLLPLRSPANPAASFLEHVACCTRAVFDAYDHQLYPYSRLVKDLNLRRDPSRLTLVEGVFNLDQSVGPIELFGRPVEVETTETGFTAWDLGWNVTDRGGDLLIKCQYNADLFLPATIRRWLDEYDVLLGVAVENPQDTLAALNARVDERLGERRSRTASALRTRNLERLKHATRKTAIAAV